MTRQTIKFPLAENGELGLNMDLMTLEQQEEIWLLSRDYRVIYQDVTGVWWDILDTTN